jgi:hypothetical protein
MIYPEGSYFHQLFTEFPDAKVVLEQNSVGVILGGCEEPFLAEDFNQGVPIRDYLLGIPDLM